MAAGVIGGGALVGVSLLAIRSSVDTMIAVMTARRSGSEGTGPAAGGRGDCSGWSAGTLYWP